MRKFKYFEILPEIAWQNSSTLRSPNSETPGPNEPKKWYVQLHSIYLSINLSIYHGFELRAFRV